MKKIFTQFKALALTIGFLLSAMTVSAQLRFIAEQTGPNPIAPGEEGQIKVSLVTSDEALPMQSMQFTVELPAGLSFKEDAFMKGSISMQVGAELGRFNPASSTTTGKIVLTCAPNYSQFSPEKTYEIAIIDVVADKSYSGTHNIKLSTCILAFPESFGPKRVLADVTFPFVGLVQVSEVKISGLPEVTIRPTTQAFQLTATLTPENADYKTVTWSSDKPAVATVDATTGKVTPIAEGKVTITATVDQPDEENGKGSITIDVLPIVPTSIKIQEEGTYETREMLDGESRQLVAIVLPDNAKDKSVTWSSSDIDVITVDENGLVTAHAKVGQTKIKATSNADESVFDEYTMAVMATPVIGVTIAGGDKTLSVGGSVTLQAIIAPETATYKDVEWMSSRQDVATIDENGVVNALSIGETSITAKSKYNNFVTSDPITVTVIPVAVTGITLSPAESTLKVGETVSLTATLAPENASNKNVIWSSSNESIATVENGTVTAVGVGEAEIIATAADGSEVKGSTKIIVVPTPVDKFVITGPASMQVGTTTKIEVTIEPSTATATMADITWESSDETMATVDAEGNVTVGGTPGEVTISATLLDPANDKQLTAECKIKIVGIAVTAISFETAEPINLKDGESIELKVNIEPEEATDKSVTWTSDKEDVATVDQNGKVTAKAKLGEATITATANGGDNVKATIKVNVIATPVESINVIGDKSELKVGESLQLTYEVTPVTATDKTVVWSSSDTDVATVDENGTVQAISVGEVTITATANDGSGIKGEYTVNVVPTPWSPETAFDPAEWELVVGESFTATLNILPEDATYKDYKISIEPEGVLSYEKGNGSVIFTALAEGKATVTATPVDGEGNEAEGQAVMTVTVNATPEVIDNDGVSVTEIDLPLNSTIALYGNTDNVVAWKVIEGDGAEIASAEDNQVVLRGTKMGTTVKIQATFSNGEVVTITVNVTEPIDVYTESVTLTPSNKIVYLGDSFTPSVTLSPADHTGETLNWSSSDKSVATVNPEGEIVAVGYGVATITLTVTNSNGTTVSASCVVIVSSATGIDGTSTAGFAVTVNGREIIVTGLGETDHADVYNISGRLVATGKGNCIIPVSAGLYVVKADGKAVKVAVK